MTPRPSGMGIKAQRRQSPPLRGAGQLCSRNSFILALTFPWLCQGQSPAATRAASTEARREGTGLLPRPSPPARPGHSWASPAAVASGRPQRGTAGLSPTPSIPAANPTRSLLAEPWGAALPWLQGRRDFPPRTPPGFHKIPERSLAQLQRRCPPVSRGAPPAAALRAGRMEQGGTARTPRAAPAVSSCFQLFPCLPFPPRGSAAQCGPAAAPDEPGLGSAGSLEPCAESCLYFLPAPVRAAGSSGSQ